MKQTQTIFLNFASGKSSTSQTVSVPFKVKTIHVKALNLKCGDELVTSRYVTIESDLVNNQSMGSTFNNSFYSVGTIQDIKCSLWNPQVIQGNYTFTMKQSNGSLYPASTGGDNVVMIVEFNSPEEIM